MDLLSLAGVSGVQNGDWFSVPPDLYARVTVPYQVTLSAGTATVVLQGRIDANHSTPVQVDSRAASGGTTVALWPQMRVILSASTAATVRASIDAPRANVIA